MSTGGTGNLRDVEDKCGRPKVSRKAPGHEDVERKRLRCAKITRALDLGELIRNGSNPACKV